MSGTWIDKDFTDGTLSAAFKFRTDAYGKEVQETYDNEEWCQATIFSESSNAISGKPLLLLFIKQSWTDCLYSGARKKARRS
jgi:hypothetical protein